jgi:hypothetical protein
MHISRSPSLRRMVSIAKFWWPSEAPRRLVLLLGAGNVAHSWRRRKPCQALEPAVNALCRGPLRFSDSLLGVAPPRKHPTPPQRVVARVPTISKMEQKLMSTVAALPVQRAGVACTASRTRTARVESARITSAVEIKVPLTLQARLHAVGNLGLPKAARRVANSKSNLTAQVAPVRDRRLHGHAKG